MLKDYQSFLNESLAGITLPLKVGNFIMGVDPDADFWYQQTVHIKDYEDFLKKAKDSSEDDYPAMIEKAKELKIFQTVPSDVWSNNRIIKTEKVKTEKDCYNWKRDFVITYLELFVAWTKNKKEQ
jgi:hypothetical protein